MFLSLTLRPHHVVKSLLHSPVSNFTFLLSIHAPFLISGTPHPPLYVPLSCFQPKILLSSLLLNTKQYLDTKHNASVSILGFLSWRFWVGWWYIYEYIHIYLSRYWRIQLWPVETYWDEWEGCSPRLLRYPSGENPSGTSPGGRVIL